MTTSSSPDYSALQRALGRQLAAERNGAGLSIEALAERSGVHKNSIGRYERAERDIPLKALGQIADALGILPSQLMLGAEVRAARDAGDARDA